MAIHLPTGSLKTSSGLELLPRCEPSTYQPISRRHKHCAIGASIHFTLKVLYLYSWNCHKGVFNVNMLYLLANYTLPAIHYRFVSGFCHNHYVTMVGFENLLSLLARRNVAYAVM